MKIRYNDTKAREGLNFLRRKNPMYDRTPYETDTVAVLETNIDDMNPQDFKDLEERLFAAGALDVYITPIMMKKMRPANKLSCIAPTDLREKLGAVILRHSSALGVRWCEMQRMKLRRESVKFSCSFGEVTLKLAYWGGELLRAVPEYDEISAISAATGIPVAEIRARAIGEYCSSVKYANGRFVENGEN